MAQKDIERINKLIDRVEKDTAGISNMLECVTPQSKKLSTTNNVGENTKTNQAVQTQNNNNGKENEDKGRTK